MRGGKAKTDWVVLFSPSLCIVSWFTVYKGLLVRLGIEWYLHVTDRRCKASVKSHPDTMSFTFISFSAEAKMSIKKLGEFIIYVKVSLDFLFSH